jgi:hypothetical protein
MDESLIIKGDVKTNSTNDAIEVFPSPITDWLTIAFGEILGRKALFINWMDAQKIRKVLLTKPKDLILPIILMVFTLL